MDFKELFRTKYKNALKAARRGDEEGVKVGLRELVEIFHNQYNSNNGDAIVIKAKLKYWEDAFNKYVQIINMYGLNDIRVQKLFGLKDDSIAPSISDIMSGKVKIDLDEKPRDESEIDIRGVLPPADEKINKKDSIDIVEPEIKNPITDIKIEPKFERPVQEKSKKIGPSYNPESLADFIGQQHIVKVLMKEIAIAKKEGRRHLDNILLFGNPGLGKSTLMELIAKELGVRFELLDCSQFRNSQQSLKGMQNFFMRIARANEPVVIALDEIHMLTTELQSSLLTLLNSRIYVSPLDVNGNCVRIPVDEFTFIAATTDDDKVLDTIKNRCLRLTFQMVDYTEDELRQIYLNKIAAKGLTITDDALDICIPRSRGAIRYVNANVEGLDKELYTDDGDRISTHIDLDVAERYFERMGIDPMGLGPKDLEILNEIANDSSGTISADVLSARVGLETKKYISEFERYLIKIGFINVTGRGRSLTDKAIKYLKGDE